VDGETRAWVVYYMNRVQELDAHNDYFVTVDYPLPLRDGTVIREFLYRHPIIDMPVHAIQDRIYGLNELNRIKLCGTYFHARGSAPSIGFHEAGFASGAEAGAAVLAMIDRRRAGD
jgi:predicted NAD/FAD-binding protein